MKISHVVHQVAHGALSYADIASGGRGVTGSEQAMLYLARAQAAAGHQVLCYLPTKAVGFQEGVELVDIEAAWPRLRRLDSSDVVISWLSGDHLRQLGPKPLKIYSYQINDHMLSGFGFEKHVDVLVAVSRAHQQHLLTEPGSPSPDAAWEIIPNGVEMTRFQVNRPRVPRRCIYMSSPDRGLHWVLAMWPEIRFAYPDAEFHVYYEVQKWLDNATILNSEIGLRARYTVDRMMALRSHGVVLHGALPPAQLADEISQGDILLYPCDTIRFTEGYGVAVMEAHAAGLIPIITDTDALGEVYGKSGATVIPRGHDRKWLDRFLEATLEILNDPTREQRRESLKAFAQEHDWTNVCQQWQEMINTRMEARK